MPVKFPLNPLGSEALTFSITDRELKASSQQFDPFQDHQGSLKVTDWEYGYAPEINGIEGILHITPKVLYTFWGIIPEKWGHC